MRLGIIYVEDLEIKCIIGILPEEREKEQCIYVSAKFQIDFGKVSHQNNEIVAGVDYAEFSEKMKKKVVRGQFYLLEDLIISIGDELMCEYEQLHQLSLSVSKPDAVVDAKTVKVEMSWKR